MHKVWDEPGGLVSSQASSIVLLMVVRTIWPMFTAFCHVRARCLVDHPTSVPVEDESTSTWAGWLSCGVKISPERTHTEFFYDITKYDKTLLSTMVFSRVKKRVYDFCINCTFTADDYVDCLFMFCYIIHPATWHTGATCNALITWIAVCLRNTIRLLDMSDIRSIMTGSLWSYRTELAL